MSTEYDKEYAAAMAKLEAEAGGKKPEAETTSSDEAKDAAPDLAAEVEKLRKESESTAKALKDTKAWATRTSQELANLKREREQAEKAAKRPAILDANPGLEEAIKHVAPPPPSDPMAIVANQVEQALPDLEEHLKDPSFKAKVDAARESAAGAWVDPLIAIRDLSAVRSEYVRDKAVAAARADFEKKSKKLNAMEVEGGSGGKADTPQKADEAKKVWDMSTQDFARMRSKTLGYS